MTQSSAPLKPDPSGLLYLQNGEFSAHFSVAVGLEISPLKHFFFSENQERQIYLTCNHIQMYNDFSRHQLQNPKSDQFSSYMGIINFGMCLYVINIKTTSV